MPASSTRITTASSSSSLSLLLSHPATHSLHFSLLHLLLSVLLTLLLPTPTLSTLTLPTILSNNVILQRTPAQPILYGWSTQPADTTVTITLDDTVLGTTTVQSDGSWQYTMTAQPVSTVGHTLQFAEEGSGGGAAVVLSNVKFGDVILCGGQSNMQMTLHASFLYNETMAVVNDYTNLHLFAVQAEISPSATMARTSSPQYGSQSWLPSSNYSTVNPGGPWVVDWTFFSAVCYYTGKALYDASSGRIPIGLISGAYGGSIIETWMSPEVVPQCQPYPYNYTGWRPDIANSTSPGVIYGPMVHPLLRTQLSAVVWYQGESNGYDPARYSCSFPAMITDWRLKFAQPALSFVFVLLTPYAGFQPAMWAAQQSALALGNVYAVTTVDVMDYNPQYDGYIHPRNKSVVGERAARWIRSRVWGDSSVATQGPVVTAATARLDVNDTLHVSLTLSGNGGSGSGSGYYVLPTPDCTTCCANGTGLLSVRLASNTRQYIPTVSLSGGRLTATVPVRSTDVGAWRMSSQLIVELQWFSFPQCALYDTTSLPAMPFARSYPLTIDSPTSPTTPSAATPSSFLLPLMLVFFVLAVLSTFAFVYCWTLRRYGRLCFCQQCEGGCGRWCRETAGVGGIGSMGGSGGSSGRGGSMKWGGGGGWRGMSDAELLRQVSTDRYD